MIYDLHHRYVFIHIPRTAGVAITRALASVSSHCVVDLTYPFSASLHGKSIMQPENTKAKRQKAAVSRGRLYLKSHLGFLPGFPVRQEGTTVVWVPRHASGPRSEREMRITGEMLRRAHFGWNTLQNRFPKALPKIVEHAEHWKLVLPRLFAMLGRAVHQGEALPDSLFECQYGYPQKIVDHSDRLARHTPNMRPLLNAFSWGWCLEPTEVPPALDWMAANRRAIGNLLESLPGWDGYLAVLALWSLTHRVGVTRTAPLLAALGVRHGFHIATADEGYLKSLKKSLPRISGRRMSPPDSMPIRPPARWASAVLELVDWLRAQPTKTARVALDLFGCVVPDDWLSRWGAWWDAVEPEFVAVNRMVARVTLQPEQPLPAAGEVATLVERLASLAARMPPRIQDLRQHAAPDTLLTAIRQLSQPQFEVVHAPLLRVLRAAEAADERSLPRAAILNTIWHWSSQWWFDLTFKSKIPRVLRAFVAAEIPPSRLAPTIAEYSFSELFEEEADPVRECRAIAYWVGPLQQNSRLDLPIAVCRSVSSPDGMHAYLRQLADVGSSRSHGSSSIISCAVRIATPDELLPVVRCLHRAVEKHWNLAEDVLFVAQQLDSSAWRSLVCEAVCDGDVPRLMMLERKVRIAQDLEIQVSPPVYPEAIDTPAWASSYPAALHGSLSLFAAVMPDAEQRVARLLGRTLPDDEALHREIRAIESRLAAAPSPERLEKRLENLRSRLEHPREQSAANLARSDRRLRRAARRQILDAWAQALDNAIVPRVLRLLGVDKYPQWLREARHERVLAGILKLNRRTRELAFRLLRLRCGPPPWHLNDEAPNQRFIDHTRARGIDLEPWLGPQHAAVYTDPTGRQLHLKIEQDPLEVLQMGAYFQTCLTPGSFHFSSAVANAADVNKRVVFARDDAGRVMGRCLLAINDQGGLLAFHRYCHDPQMEFDTMIDSFVEDLADRMGTVVLRGGAVPTLVAEEWYDDGAVHISDTIPCLADGSELRKALPSIDLSSLVSRLEAALAPLPIGPFTLPLLVSLPEFQQRPELVCPLLSRISRAESLTLDVLLQAAELAHRAGDSQAASRLLRRRALPEILRESREYYSFNRTMIGRMIAVDPSVALRAMRYTRPPGVKKDDQETDPVRRRLLAEAYTALGWTKRAASLHRES
jgi:hypothetical protein